MDKNTRFFADFATFGAGNYQNSNNSDAFGAAPTLETINPHSENLKEFNNTRLFKRLTEKHRPKPYWKQYQGIYRAVLGTSFLFNVLSALTASAVVFFFVQGLTGSMTASLLITVVLLSVLEYMKRETSSKLFHTYLQFKNLNFGMLAAVIILSAISTTASYFGASQVVESLTPPPALADVAEQTSGIEGQIAGIDQQIAAAQRNTWQGKLTPRSQRTVERLTESRAALTDELMRTRERTDMQNDMVQSEHLNETMANASTFALFTLICEIALIACLFYAQYYDFRSFAEYALSSGGVNTGQKQAPRVSDFTRNNSHSTAYNMAGDSVGSHAKIGFRYGQNYGQNYNQSPSRQTPEVATESVTQPVTHSVTQPVTQPVYALAYDSPANAASNAASNEASNTSERRCEHCESPYIYGHSRQRYCCEGCRMSAWRKKTGREIHRF